MDFLPNEEQAQIIETVGNYLSTKHPISCVQEVGEDSSLTKPAQWAEMGALGWFSISLGEEFGGAGMSAAEEMLLFVEAGKYLVSPSLLATVLGARIAAYSGNTALTQHISRGETLVALAFPSGEYRWEDGYINGEFQAFEVDNAQYLLIADQHGSTLVQINDGMKFNAQQCMDEKVQLATTELENAHTDIFVPASDDDIFTRGTLLSAAFLAGIADEVKNRCVEYAKERQQFGQPIGSFQAIKHKCSEMALRCEAALSTTVQAALGLKAGLPSSTFDIMSAKILAAEAATSNAGDSVHIHGAMGFTEEMPVHLFYKRAHLMSLMFGSSQTLLSKVVQLPTPAQ
ncbi:MAG: acyl-CoA/acyl-ACP dehydrogenase [Halieaceae bacterium]|nr:acyl-CoA/acyl-ACP dehydrogenase [Halieaceae bacterium]